VKTIRLPDVELDLGQVGFFRFAEVGEDVVITNDLGEFELLSRAEFSGLLRGDVGERREAFVQKAFLREGVDLNALAERLARKRRWMDQGPHLHAIVTTLRCNQSCRYCHASRTDMDRVDTDMSLETAKQVVDFALKTPSPYINFEFQGGEPTVNMDVIKFVVAYSKEKNRYEDKVLDHSLVTNMTLMDEDKGRWLLDNGVLICTSLDGPAEVHDFNRGWKGKGSAHTDVVKWIRWFNERYIEMGRDPELWHVDALMTATSKSLKHGREIVDHYVDLGIRNIHLRPLNPFGFANKTWRAIGYSMAEFMDFYVETLDYILELNRQGVQIQEGTAAVFLHKMLTPDDPNFVDIRSPIGSGTGQLGYDYDGRIYPSDEGRMIAATGDHLFEVGHVASSTWDEVVRHPTLKTLAMASLTDALPGCSTCFNAPWCGVRPLHNYMQSGDLFGQRPNTPKCTQHMGIAKRLLEMLSKDADGSTEAIFRRWTINRARET